MSKIIKCDRCGRRMRRMDGWNADYRHGIVVGHVCPDCQTPMENAEAVVNEATGASAGTRAVFPGEPGYPEAAAQHVLAIADDVLREWAEGVVASGQTAAVDPYELADRTIARSPLTAAGTMRDALAQIFAERLRDMGSAA